MLVPAKHCFVIVRSANAQELASESWDRTPGKPRLTSEAKEADFITRHVRGS